MLNVIVGRFLKWSAVRVALGTLTLQLAPQSCAAGAFRLCSGPDSSAAQAPAHPRHCCRGGIPAGGLRPEAPLTCGWALQGAILCITHHVKGVTHSHCGWAACRCFFK